MEKNNKKVINAWCMYDWANSVYSLVITSTIFPVYYNSVTRSADGLDKVDFFGLSITNTVLYSYSLSFSFLLIALLSPLLSGMADYSGRKKAFMRFFAILGSISCIAMYWFKGNNVEFGILCSVLASIGYSGSIVFYNAFLPEIATPDRYDMVSAKGYSMGYFGSVLLLVFNLVTITFPGAFGFPDAQSAVRFSFLLVGLWWIGFSFIAFYYLPSSPVNTEKDESLLYKGYLEIIAVAKSLKHQYVLRRFLLSFFFYNMGVQTVMYLAATFGDKELKLPGDQLILTVLIIQIVAMAGSYLFAYLSNLKGNKTSLMVMILIWIGICIAAYFVLNVQHFFALAFVVGLVMGGIQALSRSTYSKLIPAGTKDTTSYFSFFDATFNLSIVFGTFSYGLIEQITGSMRNSTFALTIFFMVGLGFLLLVKIPLGKGMEKAA